MTSKSETAVLPKTDQTSEAESELPKDKKIFVEPEISSPVNVLEATTFFQFTTSGGTI